MFLKVDFLKISKKLTGKHPRWNFFLIKLNVLSSATLFKKGSNAGFFCEICEIFKSTFFYSTPRVAAFSDKQQ